MQNKAGLKIRDSARMFAALGDENRLHIIATLCEMGPQSISKLTGGKKITRQGITKHLQILQASGLADSHQEGREKIWKLDQKRLQIAKDYLELVSAQWDTRLQRLKTYIETTDR